MADSLDSLVRANYLKTTLVVTSLKSGKQYTYNETRAGQQFLPASTFKIPNTLISLQEKAISGLHDTIRWDGNKRFIKSWNHDQDLNSAFQISCVWFFQELATRVGQDAFLSYLKKMEYGNQL
ncbi:MAG: class D beta-lactamase, partial [Bacteroidetes bacterium HGW-Bacteroidetes-22]